ncbi:PTS IIA-like nitrogen regulatory protein PtsN [Gammaproteobacteria bacterium AB-CW1]|uniref:PTS IIA-like nitrogen regulatory protein PtsN n=1 Tax=Natronospira elongata TaxID=3110268 RepID=A0AAP6JDF8_9GAMM|nr:PTS IIA-like nitrogen regulatory protein PtsN [Gammaproteobacteria bacterium AB-CW1]
MKISELLAPERIRIAAEAGGKKRALEILSELLADTSQDLSRNQVFTSMLGRERLGSTAIGSGIAIPHGRIEGLEESIGAFIRLQDAVDFDAADGAPVDMLFALIVPSQCAEEHLNALAALAHMFSHADFCDMLRKAEGPEDICKLLRGFETEAQQSPA